MPLFWKYLFVHKPNGGLNHPGSQTDSQDLLRWFPFEVSFVSEGGLLPSWRAKATQYRVPTSTASLCPPTHTSSHTCWGACHHQLFPAFPSVGIAPPHQPVSKLTEPNVSLCSLGLSLDNCWGTGSGKRKFYFSSCVHEENMRAHLNAWDSFILILFGWFVLEDRHAHTHTHI